MTDVAAEVWAHLQKHFAAEPNVACVTFLGLQPIDVLRFGPDTAGVLHYASVGGSRATAGTARLRGTKADAPKW